MNMKLRNALVLFPCLIVIIHLAEQVSSEGTSRKSEIHNRFKSLDRIRSRLDGNGSADDAKDGAISDPGSFHSFDPLPGNALGNLSTSDVGRSSSSSGTVGSFSQSGTDQIDSDDDDDDDDYEDEEDQEDILADKLPPSRTYSSYRQRFFHQPQTTTTTTTTSTTMPPPPPSSFSYSQYKWQQLGSRQGVDQYRRTSYASVSSSSPSSTGQRHHGHHHGQHHGHHYSQRSQPVHPPSALTDAINHALKVSKEGSCSVPKPRLIRIQDFYPHPGKSYLPHCTILHQCTDDTGCCRHETKTCSPKTTQRVELAFYITTYGTDSSKGSTVERLVFYNHTECECRDRMDDIMPRDGGRTPSGPSVAASRSQSYSASPESMDPFPISDHRRRGSQCRCSTHYAERILPDGACSCDCFDKQKECLQLKRGKDYFSMQDKWCIKTGRCEVPTCAFGSYIHLAGRCPRKKERYSPPLTWQRYMAS